MSSKWFMNFHSHQKALLEAAKAKQIDDLCQWIEFNCEQTIGWSQLIFQSGLQHKQLIELFKVHKKQTPMAFVRKVRLSKKIDANNTAQANLFESDDF